MFCGNIIPMRRSRDKAKDYCNRACAARCLVSVPLQPCSVCGSPMKPLANSASVTGRRQTCSRKCAAKKNAKTHLRCCARCGKTFVLVNIAYEKRGKGRYCSQSCGSRKYDVNELFFDTVDTEEKAYWLGFIFADGYQDGSEMIVNLQLGDREHLEKLKRALDSTRPIVDRRSKNRTTLHVASVRLCAALNALGCVRAKSLVLRWPLALSPLLVRHFIRGQIAMATAISAVL